MTVYVVRLELDDETSLDEVEQELYNNGMITDFNLLETYDD